MPTDIPAIAPVRRNRKEAAQHRVRLQRTSLEMAAHAYRTLRLADEAMTRSGDDADLRREAAAAQRQCLGALELAIPHLPEGLERVPWLLNVERAR